MQTPFGPWLLIVICAATVFALLFDLAGIGGQLLRPWFGWMLP